MRIEILISTMNKKDIDFVDKMNIIGDVVVGNQNGENKICIYEKNYGRIKCINSDSVGLANNRNITIINSDADICLLADDDMEYIDGYHKVVEKYFEEYPNIDVVIFNLAEKHKQRYVTKKKTKVWHFNYMRYGSVRIAFRRQKIVENNIEFDPLYGAGGEVPMGEDTIFLHDCLKKGLKIIAVPDVILTLKDERESTWFKGYDEQYFINKGKLFRRISPQFSCLLCIQDIVRHKKKYTSILTSTEIYKLMRGKCKKE